MTTHEVLVAGRNALDRRGYDWFSGRPSGDCPVCPEAALMAGAGVDYLTFIRHEAPEAIYTAQRMVAEQLPRPYGGRLSIAVRRESLEQRREFTKDEVLALFDRAIAATAPQPPFETLQPEATERAPGPVVAA